MSTFSIHPETDLGYIHLTISDLERSIEFYDDVLGFSVLEARGARASLGVDSDRPLLVLSENRQAQPKSPHSTGLYHFAILLPSRLDLARSLRRLAEQRYPLGGASDHLVSEALYLSDPDDNGIELYRDRPRREWTRRDGQLQISTLPLDLEGLLGELERDGGPWDGLPSGTRLGHVHLHVADLPASENFYNSILGFDMIARYGPSAIFVSAGGYHHHIGLNVWAGRGVPPPPPDAVGLRYFAVRLPDKGELDRILKRLQSSGVEFEEQGEGVYCQDPSGNGLLLTYFKLA
jgi:catechol 2,3-dioxygenase